MSDSRAGVRGRTKGIAGQRRELELGAGIAFVHGLMS